MPSRSFQVITGEKQAEEERCGVREHFSGSEKRAGLKEPQSRQELELGSLSSSPGAASYLLFDPGGDAPSLPCASLYHEAPSFVARLR